MPRHDDEKFYMSQDDKGISVSLSSTQFGETGFVYPGFALMIEIGLQKAYAKPE
jgi:hypothetical protein